MVWRDIYLLSVWDNLNIACGSRTPFYGSIDLIKESN